MGWVRTPSHEVSFTFNPTCDDDVDDDDDDGEDDEYDDADDDDGDDDDMPPLRPYRRCYLLRSYEEEEAQVVEVVGVLEE